MILDHLNHPIYERTIVRQRNSKPEFMVTAIQKIPYQLDTICSVIRIHSMKNTDTLLLYYVMDKHQSIRLLDTFGNEWESV